VSKIRKQWFFSFLAISGVGFAVDLLSISEGESLAELEIVRTLIWFCITCHFAYHKRGTKWLMCILIAMGLGISRDISEISKEISLLSDPLERLICFVPTAGVIALYCWFWVNCLRYRNENLLLKNSFKVNSDRTRSFVQVSPQLKPLEK